MRRAGDLRQQIGVLSSEANVETAAPGCPGERSSPGFRLSIRCTRFGWRGCAPRTAGRVFSSMTSFTQCSGTSFTLLRERSERGGAIKDDVEECGHSGTTGALRSGGESAGEDIRGSLSGVRGLSTHGIFVAAALLGTGTGRGP